MYSKNQLIAQIKELGVEEGDVLLVRADLGAIGKLDSRQRNDYIQFILDAIGKNGTLVGLSFTNGSFLGRNKKLIFDGTNKSYTGAFANVMLKHSSAKRSSHPTNSYVAIGKESEYILKGHDAKSGAYDPIKKIIELNGKMLLIGCVETSPGFTTTHLAEVDLDLHKKIILPSLSQAYYNQKGETKLFKRRDMGGCSKTFFKFYGFYVREELLKQAYVGNAYSLLINAKDAYELDRDILKNNSKITLCDDMYCMLCRARRWDNLKDVVPFIFRNLLRYLSKK